MVDAINQNASDVTRPQQQAAQQQQDQIRVDQARFALRIEIPRAPDPTLDAQRAAVNVKREITQNLADKLAQDFNRRIAKQNALQFTVNEKLSRITFKLIDTETDEIIREVPLEEIQRVAEKIQEYLDSTEPKPPVGTIFDLNV